MRAWVLNCFSSVRLCANPWTVAHQAPLSMGFSRHEYWSGLPCPPSGDLLGPGTEPASFALAGRFFTTELPGKDSEPLWKRCFCLLVTYCVPRVQDYAPGDHLLLCIVISFVMITTAKISILIHWVLAGQALFCFFSIYLFGCAGS